MRSFKGIGAAVAAALVGLCAGTSRAGNITATFMGVEYPTTVTVTLNNNLPSPNNQTYTVTGEVGEYEWTQTSPSSAPLATNFTTFCIEINQDINFNQPPYTYTVASLASAPQPNSPWISGGMGAAKAAQIDELWGQDFSKINNATTAAEFQYAVWYIVYGSELSVDSTNTPLLNTAKTWVSNLNTSGPTADVIALVSGEPTNNGDAQDQITAIPLPSSAYTGLALLGGLGLVAGVRSRRLAL